VVDEQVFLLGAKGEELIGQVVAPCRGLERRLPATRRVAKPNRSFVKVPSRGLDARRFGPPAVSIRSLLFAKPTIIRRKRCRIRLLFMFQTQLVMLQHLW